MKHLTDVHGQTVNLPKIGDKVLRDGYVFTVSEVVPHMDVCIIATIILRGEGGSVETGYYDFLLHKQLPTHNSPVQIFG